MGSVVVLGSLNRDLVLRLDRHPRPGETLRARGTTEQPGGKGANQAGAAARAGARVRMVGAVGDDTAAHLPLDALRAEGVDVTGVRRVDGTPTGLAVVSVDAGGENAIVVVPGANDALDEREVAAARVGPGDVLLCQLEVPLATVARGASRAHRAGALVVLNAAPADPAVLPVLDDVDVLLVNQHEATLLTDEDDALAAADRLARDHRLVCVVTLGDRGAVARGPDGAAPLVRSAPRVEAVDTTGAGDAFAGYLAAGLVGTDDPGTDLTTDLATALTAALTDAVAAGAAAVTRHGAMAGAPRRADLTSSPTPT